MDTAIGTFQADQEAAFTPTLGKIKPMDIFWLEPWVIDETIVTNLGRVLARGEDYLHPPAVRDEGDGRFRLIQGLNRVEAWKRCRGEHTPMPVIIHPPHTPDEEIERLKLEENLFRTELSAAERTTQEMRWVALSKKLSGGKPVTRVSETGEAAESGNLIPISTRARRGRGNKGMALQVADKFGTGKRAVNMRRQSAAAVIGEEIDFDCDTPEELERKAAELERKAHERQHAERKVVRPKRRKPAPCAVTEDATPAESQAGEIDSEIEQVWRDFSALSARKQLTIMLRACQLRGWALKLGRARRVPAVDEDSAVALPLKAAPATYDTAVDSQPQQQEGGADISVDDLQHGGEAVSQAADQEPELAVDLPTEVAPATDAVAEQAEYEDDVAVAHAEVDDEAAAVQASQGDNGAEFGAADLQDAGDDVSEPADLVIGVKNRCAHCHKPLLSSDLPKMKYGRFWHRKGCLDHAKPIAIAA